MNSLDRNVGRIFFCNKVLISQKYISENFLVQNHKLVSNIKLENYFIKTA